MTNVEEPRLLWVVSGAFLVVWMSRTWDATQSSLALSLFSLATFVVAIATVMVNLARRPDDVIHTRVIPVAMAMAVLGNLWIWAYQQVVFRPGYGLDEAAFVAYAGSLWSQGINPYAVSLKKALTLYHVPSSGWTWQLNGQLATHFSYPALPFEITRLLFNLGWTVQVPITLSVIGWSLSIILMYRLLPQPMKPLSFILGSMSPFINSAVSGSLGDWVLPAMILASYRWDRSFNGKVNWFQSTMMGIAISINQIAWLVVPFLLVGLLKERRLKNLSWGASGLSVAQYFGGAVLIFLLVNAPFIMMSPTLWARGIFGPLWNPLLPEGQGAIALTLFYGLAGGALHAITLFAGSLYAILLVLFWYHYARLKPMLFVIPIIPLFFATRSFLFYFETLAVVGILSAMSVDSVELHVSSNVTNVMATVAGLVGLAMVMWIPMHPSPLLVRLQSLHWAGPIGRVQALSVNVTNHSSVGVSPHFFIVQKGVVSNPWTILVGPPLLAPHQNARYWLVAPTTQAMPTGHQPFRVLATTGMPGSVSVSQQVFPTGLGIRLILSGVSEGGSVSVGETVTVEAQLVNRWGSAVARPGVQLALSQTYYSSHGTLYSQVRIDNQSSGQSPVLKTTNRNGQAIFTIKDSVASTYPVYLSLSSVSARPIIMMGNYPLSIVFTSRTPLHSR